MLYTFPQGTDGQLVALARYRLQQHQYIAEYDDEADGTSRLQVTWPDDSVHDEEHALRIIDAAVSESGTAQYSETDELEEKATDT